MKTIINIKYIESVFFLMLLFSVILSECPENFIESNQSTPEDIVCLPELFEHNITTLQSGYFIIEVELDGELIVNDDWVGAFNEGVCIGTKLWNVSECGGGVCNIVIFGNDGGDYSDGYIAYGQIPTFKIYDVSENIYYDANTIEPAEPWENLNISIIDLITNQIFGCTNLLACNYNPDAVIEDGSCDYDDDDDGVCNNNEILGCMDPDAYNFNSEATDEDFSCMYSFSTGVHFGANLVSYYVLPSIEDDYNLIGFINEYYESSSLYMILNATNAAYLYDDIGWIGSLVDINRQSGYWILLEEAETTNMIGFRPDENIIYQLTTGSNLISFPSSMAYSLEDALPSDLDGLISYVISENESAYYENGVWYGSLTNLEGFKGYWFKSLADVDFSFDLSDGAFARGLTLSRNESSFCEICEDYNQSTAQSFYYVREIPGIEEGDWIVAFNGGIVVGARQWNGYMTDIPVMGYDQYDYSIGYMDNGDAPQFKLYQTRTGLTLDLYGNVEEFSNNEIFIVDQLFNKNITVPNSVTLDGAYPNPFNPVTNIKFSVPERMHVEMNILDIQGRLVDKIVQSTYDYGNHEVVYNADFMSSGIYFVQLITDTDIKYSKIILLK